MPMTVGHKEPDAAHIIAQPAVYPRRAAVTVTVPRHLIKPDGGKFLLHGLAVVKMVAKVDHRIRAKGLHAIAHKAHAGVGVG